MKDRPAMEQTTFLFREALQIFVDKVKQDDQVIAAILLGSLSYDQVWEKSDIDLKLIVQEQKLNSSYTCFVENDIPINTSIQTRNEFKRWIERSVQGSFNHSMLVRSTLLFTKDATITEYFEQIRYMGERDRQIQLMRLGCHMLGLMAKVEKWLYVKRDPTYSALWLLKSVDVLAQIEVLLHGDIPMRESVQQALTYNPILFHKVYTEMIDGAVTKQKLDQAITAIKSYMDERAEQLFPILLTYLKEEADVRTVTDISEKLRVVIDFDTASITTACDWLAERGLLMKMELEIKVTPKSRHSLLEPAYLFENFDEFEMEM